MVRLSKDKKALHYQTTIGSVKATKIYSNTHVDRCRVGPTLQRRHTPKTQLTHTHAHTHTHFVTLAQQATRTKNDRKKKTVLHWNVLNRTRRPWGEHTQHLHTGEERRDFAGGELHGVDVGVGRPEEHAGDGGWRSSTILSGGGVAGD